MWPIGESPRWGHKCHVAGKRQMLTVGGNVTNLRCDWEVKGVAVWDMSNLTWGSVFLTNLSDYQVPRKVLPLTGGTIDGNATLKTPALNWTDPRLATVFATPRRSLSTNPTDPPPPKKTKTGTIAGIVIGSIAALAIIATLAFILHRHHLKSHTAHELHNTSTPPQRTSSASKHRHELQAVNENNPAELYGPDIRELESPRHAHEADGVGSMTRAELPGTNSAPGAVHGVPIVRTPGDELPVRVEYVGGLRRVERSGEKELLGGDDLGRGRREGEGEGGFGVI